MRNSAEKPIFGQEGGMLYVNSAQGTPGAWEAIVDIEGKIPLDQMIRNAEAMANEPLVIGDAIFGRVAIRRYIQDSSEITGRRYTAARCRQLINKMDFLDRVHGVDWTCVGSLTNFLSEHVSTVNVTRRGALERALAARIEDIATPTDS